MKKFLTLALFGAAGALTAFGGACVNIVQDLSAGQSFTDTTQSCTIGSVTFSDFTVYANAGYPSTPDTSAADLTVTVSGDELVFGTTNLGSGPSAESMTIYFQAVPGSIDSVTLMGTGQNLDETVCGVAFTIGTETCAAPLNSTPLAVNSTTLSSTSVVTTATTQYFMKDDGGNSGLTQSYLFVSSVPEPMSFSLVGVGLLGLGVVRRRIRP